jgi:hypothetical protein
MKKITLISFLSSSLIFMIMMSAAPKTSCAAKNTLTAQKDAPCKPLQTIEF